MKNTGGPRDESMKPAVAMLLYLLLIFASAAVLAPSAYGLLGRLFHWPFHRYVDRLLLVSALFWMIFFWRRLGLKSWRDLNIAWGRLPGGVLRGMAIGLAIAGVVLAAMLATGSRQWSGLSGFAPFVLSAVGLFVLATAEEFLFRGLVQSIFIREFGVWAGILATTLLFATMHYVKVPPEYQPDPVHWYSGWIAVGLSFTPLVHSAWLGGYSVVLLLLGIVLGLSVWLYQNLGLAIGIHAGLIIGQRFIELGSRTLPEADGSMSQALNAHPVTQLMLGACMGFLVWRAVKRD